MNKGDERAARRILQRNQNLNFLAGNSNEKDKRKEIIKLCMHPFKQVTIRAPTTLCRTLSGTWRREWSIKNDKETSLEF